MDPLLHDPEALAELATVADDPARSWARSLLLMREPTGAAKLPTADLLWDPILGRVPVDAPMVAAAAGETALTEGLAATLVQAPAWGVDPAGWAEAIEPFVDDAEHDALPWLCHLPGLLLTPGRMKRAVAARNIANDWLGPATVLRFLWSLDRRSADDVAAVIDRVADENLRFGVLRTLGVPLPTHDPAPDLESAIATGAARAGAPTPSGPRVRGSRKHRARAWGRHLLGDRDDLLSAAMTCALAAECTPLMQRRLLEEAAWIATFEPTDDPVGDVLERGGGGRGPTMIAARGATTPADLPRLRQAALDGSFHAAVLWVAAVPSPPPELWPVAISRSLGGHRAAMWQSLSATLAQTCADRIPGLLRDADTRTLGLELAAWAPTLPVLEALVQTPVPATDQGRRAWAWAMACTGDPVGAEHVSSLATADPELDLDRAVALCRSLAL